MLSVHLILAISKIHKLESKAINFVLEFPQADLKEDIWMNLPIDFQVDGQTEADYDRHYNSQSRLERSGLSISTSHSNHPTKTHQMFLLFFYFTKSF